MGIAGKFVSSFYKINEEALLEFENLYTLRGYKKGEVIAPTGKMHNKTSLLTSGIAKSFVLDKKGKEHIRTIFTPISIICSMSSLIEKIPSTSSYQCITECTLLEANWHEFIKLTEKHHDISLVYNKALEDAFIRMQNRYTSLSVLDATERYIQLKEKAQNIENDVPLNQIAAYLNITPIQFSRIRKNLYSR